MAKNKAQLQWEAGHYRACVAAMQTANLEGKYFEAVEIASKASEFIDGMMQYERRFESRDERKKIETVHYIFQYAPLVFAKSSLESIGDLLRAQKRIAKNTTADLIGELGLRFERDRRHAAFFRPVGA